MAHGAGTVLSDHHRTAASSLPHGVEGGVSESRTWRCVAHTSGFRAVQLHGPRQIMCADSCHSNLGLKLTCMSMQPLKFLLELTDCFFDVLSSVVLRFVG